MGSQNSSMRTTLEAEFSRLNKLEESHRDALSIAQLMHIQLPLSPYNLDPTHLGVLWVLDRSKSGLISMEDLVSLAKLCDARIRCYQNYEFQSQMQGYCMLCLRHSIAAEGEAQICKWFIKVVMCAGKVAKLHKGGRELYIKEEVVRSLHTIFKVNEIQGVEFADFWAGLREAGSEAQLLDLEDSKQKSFVPLTIIVKLLAATVAGMSKVMDEIFPLDEVLTQ